MSKMRTHIFVIDNHSPGIGKYFSTKAALTQPLEGCLGVYSQLRSAAFIYDDSVWDI